MCSKSWYSMAMWMIHQIYTNLCNLRPGDNSPCRGFWVDVIIRFYSLLHWVKGSWPQLISFLCMTLAILCECSDILPTLPTKLYYDCQPLHSDNTLRLKILITCSRSARWWRMFWLHLPCVFLWRGEDIITGGETQQENVLHISGSERDGRTEHWGVRDSKDQLILSIMNALSSLLVMNQIELIINFFFVSSRIRSEYEALVEVPAPMLKGIFLRFVVRKCW